MSSLKVFIFFEKFSVVLGPDNMVAMARSPKLSDIFFFKNFAKQVLKKVTRLSFLPSK